MRQRLTWSRFASAHPATPDEGPASPAHTQDDPGEHDYENGDTSSWAEDPTKGPYPQSAHPATPDEGPASPAYKQARLEIKAAKCIKMAKAMLGKTASVQAIEDQALTFMDLDNRTIQASLARLAGEEESEEEAEEETEEEGSKKEARLLKAQVKFLHAKLARLTRSAGKEEAEEEAEEEKETEKKASRLQRAARLRRLAGKEESEEECEDEAEEEGAKKKASRRRANFSMSSEALLEEMLAEEGMDDCESCGEEVLLEEMLAEEGMFEKSSEESLLEEMLAEEGMGEESAEESLLEEMLAEEGMMPVAPAAAENEVEANLPEAHFEPDMDDFGGDPEPLFLEDEDPMGFLDAEMAPEERLLMAKLFGKTAGDEAEEEPKEEPKKEETKKEASLKPQPKKPNPGVTRLANVTKEASSNNDLAKLWETAPDVSKFF